MPFFASAMAWADALDDCVGREMQAHGIPGVSLAIIHAGQVSARAYGNVDLAGGGKVTPETLFQAGSISKVGTALGALKLVEQGKLSLDDDVNLRLQGWKVPDSNFTAGGKVTVRRILNHTAGFTVHGFGGYAVGAPVPAMTDILDGKPPANNAAIRVTSVPGREWRYSGGGYVVLQKLMTDVTGESFADLMSKLVLQPLQMKHSTYEQPLPSGLQPLAAAGQINGQTIAGRWHVYPEMSAAGLWTTPSDLALLVIAVQQAEAGQSGGAISPTIAQWMTTPGLNNDGLGLFLAGPHNDIFTHNGRNEGFDSLLIGTARDGVVIMINANDDSGASARIARVALVQAG